MESVKKTASETSKELQVVKSSANNTQEEVDTMYEDMTDLISDFKEVMADLQSFRQEVITRCGEYVKHMEKTDVKVANIKQEMEKVQPMIEKNCEEYFDQSSSSLTKKYASKTKVKELSKNVRKLEVRINNKTSGGIKQEATSDYSETDSDTENCSTDSSSTSDTDLGENKQKETEKSANEIIKCNWYEFCLAEDWMPDKFRPSFVHPDAVSRNKVKIDFWYSESIRINIIPDEFLLVAKDRKESFHKKQKKVWKQKTVPRILHQLPTPTSVKISKKKPKNLPMK